MLKPLSALAAGALIALPVAAQQADVKVSRIDCGTGAKPVVVAERFSDNYAYKKDMQLTFVFSCYLIKHGDDYMVWDTGFAPGSNPNAPKESITEQMAKAKVTPEQVKFVGISHFHGDHTGQLAPFANATLLIGKGDWDGVNNKMPGANVDGFKDFMGGARKVEPLTADKDVFGDGSVVVLRTPGHTPGHSSLLVKTKSKTYILSGDAAHFHENYKSDGVPSFNYDRAQTIASVERIKQIAKNLKATVVIQHDKRDVGLVPAIGK